MHQVALRKILCNNNLWLQLPLDDTT
jgi:hypothetical protein